VNVSQKFEHLKERLQAKKSGDEWKAFCPNHNGKSQSLNFRMKDGKIVMICRGGCSTTDVLAALGLDWKDLFADPANANGAAKQQRKIVDVYKYVDEQGKVLHETVRYLPKKFEQRRPDGHGGWIWNLKNTRLVLFNLPEVLQADTVYLNEGEKDALTAKALGVCGTTAAMGAKAPWLKEYSETLRSKNVVVIADNDFEGLKRARRVARELHLIANSVKVITMPGDAKDLTEVVEKWRGDFDAKTLQTLAADAPIFDPDDAPVPDSEPAKDWRSLFHTFAEFEAAAKLSFLIEGFLQRQGITGLAALAESGKTWCALSIAKALLFGPGKLWDLFKVNGRAERILYLIPESSLTPVKHRIEKMGLYWELEKRLFIRTITKGDTPELTDPLLLEAVAGADLVILDTGTRFMGRVADDSSAMSVATGLSNDLLNLMRICPGAILILYHSQKGSRHDLEMNLESMIRGSGELGAVLCACWGLKQLDKTSNTLHIQNVKARDFESCGPFQLIGRPFIDSEGDFRLYKRPEDCGTLQEESPQAASNDKRHDEREDRVSMVRSWMNEEPNISIPELQTKFQALGITVKPDTVRRYQLKVRKG
jgi:AAA domain/Toprim-like